MIGDGRPLFVVVWDGDQVERVTGWYDWLTIPVEHRPVDTSMVRARDELEAFNLASRGVHWYNQGASND